jgi:hypothetical protein
MLGYKYLATMVLRFQLEETKKDEDADEGDSERRANGIQE